MKKAVVSIIVLSLLALAGCELFPTISWEDIKGEWDFPDTVFNGSTITAIHLSLMDPFEGESEYRIDLGWNDLLILLRRRNHGRQCLHRSLSSRRR